MLMKLIALVACTFTLVACGGNSSAPDGGGSGNNGGVGGNGGGSVDLAGARAIADLALAAGVSIDVVVPSSLHGTPRQLVVAAFDQFPVTGPPAGILYQASPSIVAGQTLTIAGDPGSLSGQKFVLAVLYMQGGGMLAPTANVDYVSAPAQVTFGGGGAIAIGPLDLILLAPDAGF
jgi:hypothetical protein